MIDALRGFDRGRLDVLVGSFPRLRVAVIGDFFLDKYLEVDPSLAEPSLETGKSAHQVVGVRHSPGAAGTVTANLAALGAGSLAAVGFRGLDGEGWELEADLRAMGVDVSSLRPEASRRTPVYMKPRDRGVPGLEGEHSRYDFKNRSPTPAEVERRVIDALRGALEAADALLVMDQVEDEGAGVVTPAVARAVMEAATGRPGLVAWADSRRRIMSFRGLSLKMNEFELAGVAHPAPGDSVDPSRIAPLLREAEARAGAPVFVTAGARGAWIGGDRPELVPGVRVAAPVDPTGAGDSFSAGAALALAAGASRAEAALVGCLAASVTVRKLGQTGTASPAELAAALEEWREQYL